MLEDICCIAKWTVLFCYLKGVSALEAICELHFASPSTLLMHKLSLQQGLEEIQASLCEGG